MLFIFSIHIPKRVQSYFHFAQDICIVLICPYTCPAYLSLGHFDWYTLYGNASIQLIVFQFLRAFKFNKPIEFQQTLGGSINIKHFSDAGLKDLINVSVCPITYKVNQVLETEKKADMVYFLKKKIRINDTLSNKQHGVIVIPVFLDPSTKTNIPNFNQKQWIRMPTSRNFHR